MSREAWQDTGKCSECRRQPYCKKQCRANREALKRLATGLIMEKFVEKYGGKPEEVAGNSSVDST